MSEPWLDKWTYDPAEGNVYADPGARGDAAGSLVATVYTEADGRLIAAAPALVRALLEGECRAKQVLALRVSAEGRTEGEAMNWCIKVRCEPAEIDAAICEAATYGREVAAAVPLEGIAVLLIFRPMPRGDRNAPAHVYASIVDRNGYSR